jgi:TFIIS helical bundle-like domain
MEKFLTSGGSNSTAASHSVHTKPSNRKGQQQRLADCKKVVKLSASKYSICQAELASLREALESPTSTVEELSHCLRHLDSLVLHTDALIESQVGRSVKKLRKHPNSVVSACWFACRLLVVLVTYHNPWR